MKIEINKPFRLPNLTMEYMITPSVKNYTYNLYYVTLDQLKFRKVCLNRILQILEQIGGVSLEMDEAYFDALLVDQIVQRNIFHIMQKFDHQHGDIFKDFFNYPRKELFEKYHNCVSCNTLYRIYHKWERIEANRHKKIENMFEKIDKGLKAERAFTYKGFSRYWCRVNGLGDYTEDYWKAYLQIRDKRIKQSLEDLSNKKSISSKSCIVLLCRPTQKLFTEIYSKSSQYDQNRVELGLQTIKIIEACFHKRNIICRPKAIALLVIYLIGTYNKLAFFREFHIREITLRSHLNKLQYNIPKDQTDFFRQFSELYVPDSVEPKPRKPV